MAASSRAQVLDLYRAMLRESKRFSSYNYRTYAIRRIRDAFRENKNVKDPVEIQTLVNKARRDLGIIRRQCLNDHPKQLNSACAAVEGEAAEAPLCLLPGTAHPLLCPDCGRTRVKVHISHLYSTDKLVIENQEKPRT